LPNNPQYLNISIINKKNKGKEIRKDETITIAPPKTRKPLSISKYNQEGKNDLI
jgi:hypothetical protein